MANDEDKNDRDERAIKIHKEMKDYEEYDENYVPTAEDFVIEEKDREENRKPRKLDRKKIIAISLVFILCINVIAIWPKIFNLDAFKFLKTSYTLSQDEEVSELKKTIVSVKTENGKGTGFVVGRNHYIITNHHVIEDANQIYVEDYERSVFSVENMREFPNLDLAILQVNQKSTTVTSISDEDWSVGDEVFFIGNPLAFYRIANQGEIIGTTDVNSVKHKVIMIEAPVYDGNSGSPLFNKSGEVIGVIFGTLMTDEYGKVGLAVPISAISEELALK